MSANVDLWWPSEPSEELYRQIHRILYDVADDGGAIGWLVPPAPDETRAWAGGVLADVAAGDGALCLAVVDGVAQGTGCWRRSKAPIFRHGAEVTKIMAHPSARGLGLGRSITAAVVAHAEAAGIETLQLGVRGNNHLAIALYEEVGFQEWGRLPNAIEVGNLRFDEVRMYRKGPKPPQVTWLGSRPVGPGSSRRPDLSV